MSICVLSTSTENGLGNNLKLDLLPHKLSHKCTQFVSKICTWKNSTTELYLGLFEWKECHLSFIVAFAYPRTVWLGELSQGHECQWLHPWSCRFSIGKGSVRSHKKSSWKLLLVWQEIFSWAELQLKILSNQCFRCVIICLVGCWSWVGGRGGCFQILILQCMLRTVVQHNLRTIEVGQY